MGYGEGDYGTGDYGAGDFLGIGHALKKIGGGILHAAGGVVRGVIGASPVGQVIRSVGGALPTQARAHNAGVMINTSGAGGGSVSLAAPTMAVPGPGQVTTSETSVGYGLFGHKTTTISGGPGTRGKHVIKKGPHMGQLTSNRYMNVTNPRALRRAIRRARGFEKMARKVLGFTSPHRPKGRAYFRKTRKR